MNYHFSKIDNMKVTFMEREHYWTCKNWNCGFYCNNKTNSDFSFIDQKTVITKHNIFLKFLQTAFWLMILFSIRIINDKISYIRNCFLFFYRNVLNISRQLICRANICLPDLCTFQQLFFIVKLS